LKGPQTHPQLGRNGDAMLNKTPKEHGLLMVNLRCRKNSFLAVQCILPWKRLKYTNLLYLTEVDPVLKRRFSQTSMYPSFSQSRCHWSNAQLKQFGNKKTRPQAKAAKLPGLRDPCFRGFGLILGVNRDNCGLGRILKRIKESSGCFLAKFNYNPYIIVGFMVMK
jgi:hypothetical protein